jgi:hypothetical protein
MTTASRVVWKGGRGGLWRMWMASRGVNACQGVEDSIGLYSVAVI